MTKVAFLGLGQMGAPMAGRLLGAGHDLTVWNRTASKADPVVDRGAVRADTPREAAGGAEGVFTMLADPTALEDVLFGADGAVAGMDSGATLIERSTVGPEAFRDVAERLPEGVEVIDAPVLGSIPHAEQGSLTVYVGGPREAFERWGGVLRAMGTPIHVGPLGAGASMKLVANSTLGALMGALGEALALADALGLDERRVLEVLADSAIGVTARSKRERIESGSYPPNFKLALAAKDLRLVTETAEHAGRDLRVARAARSWLEEAEAAGLEDLDYSAIVAHIRKRPARGPGGESCR